MKEWMKKTAVCLAVVLAITLVQGCGGAKTKTAEERLAGMQEVTSSDGVVSIYLDKDWEVPALENVGGLYASNGDSSEIFMMFQFLKGVIDPEFAGQSLDGVKSWLKENYDISGEKEAEAPEMTGMENVSAQTVKIYVADQLMDAYIVYGETGYAYYGLLFIAETMNDDVIPNALVSCSKFVERAPEDEDTTIVEMTDTVRWFNASYAILAESTGCDYNRFGGLAATERSKAQMQQLLSQWLGVTDRASAEAALDLLLNGGYRANFVEDMEYLKQGGFFEMDDAGKTAFLEENFNYDSDEIAYYAAFYSSAYEAYEQNGEKAVAGRDYCSSMYITGLCYLAGYYTETEALDKSLEIAQLIQPEFTSWDELVESYLLGYEYGAKESSEEDRSIYEDLKGRADNPYAVDYNITFEKTW